MSLTIGYASDINLWFIFSIAVLYRYAITENAVSAKLVETNRETVLEYRT
jgi:hypothetical protein